MSSATLPTLLHLDDGRDWRGGQRQVLLLHEGLLAHGHDSRVVCVEGSALHRRLDERRLPHYAMTIQGGHDVFTARRIGAFARREGALLHAHTSHAHDLALWAGRLGGARHIVVSRRAAFPVGANLFSRRKYTNRRVGRYLAISRAVATELERVGVEAERIRVVPSGVDLGRVATVEPAWSWRSTLRLAPGELLVGTAAALTPEKDLASLVRAFARWRERSGSGCLVVLGDGPERAALSRLAEELGVAGQVHLPGFEPDVLPLVAAMDIFVLSSQREGLGTALVDAMACGRPVIATRSGGPEDVIEDGRSGKLVDVGDVEAMAAALHELQSSAALRQRLGHEARLRAEHFDARLTVERTIAVYREWLDGRS